MTDIVLTFHSFHVRPEPYDPPLQSGGAPSKTQKVQNQILETQEAIRHNIDALHQRGEDLNTLQNKTSA